MFARLFVALALAALAALTGGCASSSDYRESADGSKREVTESTRCIGIACGTQARGATIYVAPGYAGAGRGYDHDSYRPNRIDGSRRGSCYGVVYGPGPEDRRMRYEPTLQRDQFGRPSMWVCAPGRRNSLPGPDGCCAD